MKVVPVTVGPVRGSGVPFLDSCASIVSKNISESSQSLSQRSKTRTSVADPGSASGGTFQCMQFLPFFI